MSCSRPTLWIWQATQAMTSRGEAIDDTLMYHKIRLLHEIGAYGERFKLTEMVISGCSIWTLFQIRRYPQ
jgi:hypothetical protein